MTYAVALLLDAGMIFASDSRTNAGVDNISCFRKMKVFERPGDRVVVILSAGNLAITQATVTLMEEWAQSGDPSRSIDHASTLFQVARIAGAALRDVHESDADPLRRHNVEFAASLLVGGQIRGERPRLFQLYAAGNFIEATPETPFFQIGETKYGKPVFDRLLTPAMPLGDAGKLTLISFDSTMRSNLSVGMPIDFLCLERDHLRVSFQRSLSEGHPYLAEIRQKWGDALRRAFEDIPPMSGLGSGSGR